MKFINYTQLFVCFLVRKHTHLLQQNENSLDIKFNLQYILVLLADFECWISLMKKFWTKKILNHFELYLQEILEHFLYTLNDGTHFITHNPLSNKKSSVKTFPIDYEFFFQFKKKKMKTFQTKILSWNGHKNSTKF